MDFEAQLDVQPTMWSVWVIGSNPIDIPKIKKFNNRGVHTLKN